MLAWILVSITGVGELRLFIDKKIIEIDLEEIRSYIWQTQTLH